MNYVLDALTMKEADQYTILTLNIPSLKLMENAGEAIFSYIKNNIHGSKNYTYLILTGSGNNGGDGFVVGRKLLEENYKNLKKKTFLLAFPKYLGTSTCILQEMETVQAWYQFAVNEILIGKLKWLLPLDGGYTMFHQDFEVYLAYRGELQKKQWNVWQKKAVRKKTIAIALITLVLTVGGIHVWIQHSYPFFQRDKTKVQNSVENIAGILGKTYSMIQSQYQILKKISPSLLDGIQSQYDILEQEYQRLEQQAELYASITMNDSTYLTLIEDLRLSIPQKEAEELYTSAQLQCQFMQEHMSNLMNRLNPEKQYEREKKEKAISAYEQYLEAYCNWVNQRIAFVMEAYPERYRELLYQTLYTSPYFSAFSTVKRDLLPFSLKLSCQYLPHVGNSPTNIPNSFALSTIKST